MRKCKLKCFNTITGEEHTTIFTLYWKLEDVQRQRDFIGASTTAVTKKN